MLVEKKVEKEKWKGIHVYWSPAMSRHFISITSFNAHNNCRGRYYNPSLFFSDIKLREKYVR